MRPHLWILFVVLLGLTACAAVENPATADGKAGAIDWALELSALDRADQNSPETLSGRLAYAKHLMETADGDCQQRVDAAQRQLNIVAATPAFAVVMPLGAPRAAVIEYGIHSARAACSTDASIRQSELSAARDAALRAAALYRDGFDYPSMAVMQFDAAVVDRRLGDGANAKAILRSALEMDEEYGLHKDAEDNRALLQQWMKNEPDPSGAAEPTKISPSRSAALKFAWSAKDVDVGVEASYATVLKGEIVHSRETATRAVSLRDGHPGWIVSSLSNNRTYDFSDWPKGRAQSEELITLLLANINLKSPSFRVGVAGEFKSLVDPEKVVAQLSTETTQLIRDIFPRSDGRLESTPNIGKAISYFSAPSEIEATAAEDYNFTTAAWIGATLEQGVWYDMTSPMREPGTAYVVDHDIRFAFTRVAPCTSASTQSSCVELIVHATPNPVALRKWDDYLKSVLGLPWGQVMYYWSETDMKIITDPNTLLPYSSDVRRYWYSSIEGTKAGTEKDDPVISSEKTVSTWTYH